MASGRGGTPPTRLQFLQQRLPPLATFALNKVKIHCLARIVAQAIQLPRSLGGLLRERILFQEALVVPIAARARMVAVLPVALPKLEFAAEALRQQMRADRFAFILHPQHHRQHVKTVGGGVIGQAITPNGRQRSKQIGGANQLFGWKTGRGLNRRRQQAGFELSGTTTKARPVNATGDCLSARSCILAVFDP